MSGALLAARGITKRFGGVVALAGVSFDLQPGEVHALCGENGAGKSTLMKLLAGVHAADEGELLLEGRPVRFAGVAEAEAAGIALIHQELALFPQLTVAENLYLRQLPRRAGRVDWPALQARAGALLRELGFEIDPLVRVETLGVAARQLVEIARALSGRPRVLVLDEPTAALARHEIDRLLDIVRGLRARGVACIYVSHKLDEVFAVSDRITILRDGRSIATHAAAATDAPGVIRAMVGRELGELYPRRAGTAGEPLLRVSGLAVAPHAGAPARLQGIDFEARAGEVLGIGGLMGAGRSELLLHLAGRYGRRLAGSASLAGTPLPPGSVRAARAAGLALVTEDRKATGLVLGQGIAFNLTLASLARLRRGALVDAERELALAGESMRALRIKAGHATQVVATLSGGNQQKVAIGKALLTQPRVLLLDEPTRGIDVGAKVEVYELVNRFTSEGGAVVMVSSELPELLGMADRILMLHEGRVGGLFPRAEASEERLLAAAMGRTAEAA